LDVVKAIMELSVGEALVSVLDDKGSPTQVERALIYPPQSQLSPITPEERTQVIRGSALYGHYEKVVDRESAFEKLKARAEQKPEVPAARGRAAAPRSQAGDLLGAIAKSAAHAVGSQIGREIIRGVLGSILGGRRR
jgi:DNA helicase HerA-like ATPase